MLLMANGCSNTHGMDSYNGEVCDENRNLAFPKHIADHFDMDYLNIAHPCVSNEYIAHTTIDWIENWIEDGGTCEELFIVIGLTASVRKTLVSDEYGIYTWNTGVKNGGISAFTAEQFDIVEDYFKLWLECDTSSDYHNSTSYHHVNYLHLYLKEKNIKHFMINTCNMFTDYLPENRQYMKKLATYVECASYNDRGCNMYPYYKNYKPAPRGHITGETHGLLGQKCIEYITNHELLIDK